MPRTVLVTGAAGGLGRALIPVLRSRGWRVRALVHRRPVEIADEQVQGDLADATGLVRAADGADAVLHLAARTHARRAAGYFEANVEGTRRLLAAGVPRFVQVSTRAIGAGGGGYSDSKREAERLVERSDGDWVIVRLPEVYGAGSAEGVDRIIDGARRDGTIPIVGAGDDEVCPVHVDDATAALAAALDAPAGRTYTLAGECMTTRAFAATCVAAFGGGRIVRVPVAAVRVLGLAARIAPLPLYPDQLARLRAARPAPSPEAAAELGFAPRPLEAGLRALER
ncbi:MAG TPA: NAD-dependent epimerase/dehydratase family protein [Solirubrobacteraceae bacterium]|nr:NAD-dependent epimerase/dehydratase family protein [Solirubrobacteraceae bacterium]